MKKPHLLLYVLLIVFTACIGCGKDNICTPSQKEPCSCQEGTSGTKLCSSDGTRYSACSCPALEKSDEKRPSEEDPKETHEEKLPDAGNEHSVYPEKETTFEQEPPTEHPQSEEPYKEKECIAGTEMACYHGPNNTKNIGICKPGKKTCSGAGFWGLCLGQVIPDKESCNGKDDDCNGQIDDDFPEKGTSCNTQKLGQCAIGLYTCSSSSLTCQQVHSPKLEECNGKDDNCDGKVDEGLKQSCYTGPANTAGMGVCQRGEQLCHSGQWGTCVDEVVPQTEVCNGKDDDCNGVIDDKGISTLCASGESCEGGVCYKNCQQDTDCSGNEGCQNSLCKVIQCTSPSVACAHDCQDVQKEYAHCGMCGHSCQDEQVCQSGMCICDASTSVLCSGKCTNIHVNSQHCGGCQNACSAGKFCFQKTCTDSWAQSINFAIYGVSRGMIHALTVDPSGNIYIAGAFELNATFGTITLTTPNYDTTVSAFLAKLDKHGRWLWARRIIHSTNDEIRALASDDKGNIYLAGYKGASATFGQVIPSGVGSSFIAKMNSSGKWLWVTSHSASISSLVYSNNVIYFAGNTRFANFGNITPTLYGGDDVVVAKINTNGNWVWVTTAGSTGNDDTVALSADAMGSLYVSGSVQNVATFGSLKTIKTTGSGFTAKLNATGKWMWVKEVHGGRLSTDNQGNTVITGYFSNSLTVGNIQLTAKGPRDLYVTMLDTNGNWKWAKSAGISGGRTEGRVSFLGSNGSIYLSGKLEKDVQFGSFSAVKVKGLMFIAKMDKNGNWLGLTQDGVGASDLTPTHLRIVTSHIISSGVYWGPATFGKTSLSAQQKITNFVVSVPLF